MTYEEAIELVNRRGGTKYRGKPLQLLTYLVKGFNARYAQQGVDIEGRVIKRRVSTLQLKLGVQSDDQLRRIIRSVDEVEQIKWANGRLLLKLRDLQKLSGFSETALLLEERSEAFRSRHAASERERRAAIRERRRLSGLQWLLGDMPVSSFIKGLIRDKKPTTSPNGGFGTRCAGSRISKRKAEPTLEAFDLKSSKPEEQPSEEI